MIDAEVKLISLWHYLKMKLKLIKTIFKRLSDNSSDIFVWIDETIDCSDWTIDWSQLFKRILGEMLLELMILKEIGRK